MTAVDEAIVYAISPNASFQALGEGAVVLIIDSGQLYTCNETTESFLKLVDGNRSFGQILDLMMDEFAVDRETLSQDFGPMVDELQSAGIVEPRRPS